MAWVQMAIGAVLGAVLGYLLSFMDVGPTAYASGYRSGVLAAESDYNSQLEETVNDLLPEYCKAYIADKNRVCDGIIQSKDGVIESLGKRNQDLYVKLNEIIEELEKVKQKNEVYEFLLNLISESQQFISTYDEVRRIGDTVINEWREKAREMVLDIARMQDILIPYTFYFNGKTDEFRKRILSGEDIGAKDYLEYFEYFTQNSSRKLDQARAIDTLNKSSAATNYLSIEGVTPSKQ